MMTRDLAWTCESSLSSPPSSTQPTFLLQANVNELQATITNFQKKIFAKKEQLSFLTMPSAPKTPPRNMYQASKKKRFSIKGLLGGETKKERKERQQSQAKGGNAVGEINAEADTVYQVDVDERTMSVMSEQSKVASNTEKAAAGFLSGADKKPKTYMLKVVLLLMDPETRRFELLQLEFDSDKALVSDVLTQIPVAVTEEVLKKQSYVGISGAAGTEMKASVLLSEFCEGNDVLVAVPEGVAAQECARLARPILNDDKVINMVRTVLVSCAHFPGSY